MKWLMQVSTTADEDVPKLFSTSYGEDESSWSMAAAQRLNAEFMKSGARGISLLYAAGDEGANCKGTKNLFVPEGPGSSPYVTAVGGTMPADGFPSPGSESAVGLSSGGFSARWAQPSWQTQAVAGYLSGSTALPPASRGYNTSGRAYPDIAAQATHFCVVPFGCGVAGTSCASPTAAGIIALLNDLRLSAGKPTLGFLNPLFYENAAAFNDSAHDNAGVEPVIMSRAHMSRAHMSRARRHPCVRSALLMSPPPLLMPHRHIPCCMYLQSPPGSPRDAPSRAVAGRQRPDGTL